MNPLNHLDHLEKWDLLKDGLLNIGSLLDHGMYGIDKDMQTLLTYIKL